MLCTQVVDPTGAGDAFNAGFLFTWLQRRSEAMDQLQRIKTPAWCGGPAPESAQALYGDRNEMLVNVGVAEGLRTGVGLASLAITMRGASPLINPAAGGGPSGGFTLAAVDRILARDYYPQ